MRAGPGPVVRVADGTKSEDVIGWSRREVGVVELRLAGVLRLASRFNSPCGACIHDSIINRASGHKVVKADEARPVGGEPGREAPTLSILPAGEGGFQSPFELVVPIPGLLF